MKIYLLSIALLLVSAASAQPSWRAHIVTQHPNGLTDTIVIGCDSLGDIGLQPGLDVEDSDLSPPIAIGAYDASIGSSLNCVNLSTDIRKFQDGDIVLPVYVRTLCQ